MRRETKKPEYGLGMFQGSRRLSVGHEKCRSAKVQIKHLGREGVIHIGKSAQKGQARWLTDFLKRDSKKKVVIKLG